MTIEYDDLPLAEQQRIFSAVPYSVLCFSGNKSIHCHIRFSRALQPTESRQLDSYLGLLFGDSDRSTWRANQLVRIPGGLNRSTGKLQSILAVRGRVAPEDFLAWISEQARRQGLCPQAQPTIADHHVIAPVDPISYFFPKWVLDRELVAIGNYQARNSCYNGISGIGYWNHCPRRERHTNQKSHAGEFNIHLGVDGKIRKKCFHNSCADIWRESTTALLGFAIFTSQNIEAWLQSQEFAALQITVAEARKALSERQSSSPAGETTADNLLQLATDCRQEEYLAVAAEAVAQLRQAIQDPAQHKLVIAPPGSGKSFLSAQTFLEALQHGQRILYVSSNKSDLGQFTAETERMAKASFRELNCLELKSGKIRASDSQEKIEEAQMPQDTKLDDYQGIATHHTYIQRKGLGATHYALLRWVEKHCPLVIIDEGNEFCNGCTSVVDFDGRYYYRKPNGARSGSYYRLSKCPSFETGHHKCVSCHRGGVLEFGVNKFNIPYLQLQAKIAEENFDSKPSPGYCGRGTAGHCRQKYRGVSSTPQSRLSQQQRIQISL